ncbi:helix-turn-helix domain-containing protein [Actinomycetospora straminea]|uniref:Helix-turn-helix transcriptional regulator n=1 Tax=Actinomycetospora straminea TaxID=663607 RepID=A0ABP9E778_9PSEU|nr:helix-turn-helix transcriptional regulator [Actinomycetospora straminea]MDD7932674.1 helix-turn-helix transcriptional regulator [Actinomycetospora straminea]
MQGDTQRSGAGQPGPAGRDAPRGPDRSDPSALRWLIGHELRAAREQAGHTQTAAARVLDCTHAKINYLEQGKNQQRPDEVVRLLQSYGASTSDIGRLASLASNADRGTWWAPFADVVPDWLRTFVGLEGLATAAFAYEPLLLHGLLQTRAYATALLEDALRVPVVDVDHVVGLRLARQQRLHDDGRPLRYEAVIEETILDRLVGGPTVMADQLDHLLLLSEQDNVVIRVMPLAVAVHDGLDGEFTLLDFDAARSIGYVEFQDGAVYVQDPDRIGGYRTAAARLRSAALPEDASLEVIRARRAALRS